MLRRHMKKTHQVTLPSARPLIDTKKTRRSRPDTSSSRNRRRSSLVDNGSSNSSLNDEILAVFSSDSSRVTTRKPRKAAVLASKALSNLINEADVPMEEAEEYIREDEDEDYDSEEEKKSDMDENGEGEMRLVESLHENGTAEAEAEFEDIDEDAEGEEEIMEPTPALQAVSMFSSSYTPTVPALPPSASFSKTVPTPLFISPLNVVPPEISPFHRSDAPSPPSSRQLTFSQNVVLSPGPQLPLASPSASSDDSISTAVTPLSSGTKITPDLPLYDSSFSLESRRRFSSILYLGPGTSSSFFQTLAAQTATSSSLIPASSSLSLSYPPLAAAPSSTIDTNSVFGPEIFGENYGRLSFSLSDVRRPSTTFDGLNTLMESLQSSTRSTQEYLGFEDGRTSRRNSLGLSLF